MMSRPIRCGLLLAGAAWLAACAAGPDAPADSFDPQTDVAGCSGKCDWAGQDALESLPSAPLASFFAPSEPALGVDLALIRRVIDARRAFNGTPPADGNPFRIRYAVYNLRNQYITAGLIEAEEAGVDVQILIEKDQLDPDRTWNTTDEQLVDAGFELVDDHRNLTADQMQSADLIGISGEGLMHLKTRLYYWQEPQTGQPVQRLVTGSINPGDLASDNDETLHYIEDPDLIRAYQDKYDAVLRGQSLENVWDPSAALQVLFSPDPGPQAVDRIAELIDSEDEIILMSLYSLRNVAPTSGGPGILERLVAARDRGVTVAVITDRKQSDGIDADGNKKYFDDDDEEILRAAGVPLLEVVNTHSPFNAMHTKYGVFGLSRPIVVTDAGNWTKSGIGSGANPPKNVESVLFIDSIALDRGLTASRYLGNFISILHRYSGPDVSPLNDTGGVDPMDLAGELLSLPGWPAAHVIFSAEAETSYGQTVHVTGEVDALGRWGEIHPGWPLATTEASYPMWEGEPLELPLGTRCEYKLTAVDGHDVTWEGGGNRFMLADPTDYRVVGVDASDTLSVEMSWR